MKLHLSAQAAVISLCFSLLASGEARAASFTFTKIADTNDPFSSFFSGSYSGHSFDAPSLNNGGTVAFEAGLNTGGSGIFAGNGTTTTTIADTSGSFSRFGNDTSINDGGTVAFSAGLNGGYNDGIFTGNGTTTNTIISNINDNSLPPTKYSAPSINNSGIVAYARTTRLESLFTSDGTNVTKVVDSGATSPDPVINDLGTVAYAFSNKLIQTTNGTTTSTIASVSSDVIDGKTINEAIVYSPSINNEGTVLYSRRKYNTRGLTFLTLSQDLVTSNGTTTTTIADISGPFRNFRNYSINDRGTVVFWAGLDAGGTGIFTGANPLSDKVIATGDSLLGSTVTDLNFSLEGLNNFGSVAFFAQLADGTQGIFRADPVLSQPARTLPEPASAFGLIAFGALGAGAALKRKQNSAAKCVTSDA